MTDRIMEMIGNLRVEVARLDERTIAGLRWRTGAEERLNNLSRLAIDSTHQLQEHSKSIGKWEQLHIDLLTEKDAKEKRRQALALFQWLAVLLTIVLAAAKVIPEAAVKVIFALVLGR